MNGTSKGDTGPGLTREVMIVNQRGLHARASAKFVKCAAEFNADLIVSRDGMEVLGTSIMGLMMLAAAKGSTILISASGPEAKPALNAIIAMIEAKFDED
jgi:phosphocarrier protein HPr